MIGAGLMARATWDDHPTTGPSRINPLPTRPLTYYRCTLGQTVELRGYITGYWAPADSLLDGHLFSSDFGEWPGVIPVITSIAGYSSRQFATPMAVGHYLWNLRLHRSGGGCISFHFDVEAP